MITCLKTIVFDGNENQNTWADAIEHGVSTDTSSLVSTIGMTASEVRSGVVTVW